MARLRLFGTPALTRDDGTAVTGRPAQRHRLALLALLSLAPAHRLSRDKLVAWLWPEADAERGRNLLNVATYTLRAALGEGALVSEGDHLRLDAGLVRSDVAEFEAAVREGDHERAVALHAGPFLDGFFVPEAPELEQWTERERERLTALYGRSIELLAGRAEEGNDFGAAVDWWRARAAHDPFDSRVALRLMQALESSGNRAGALQHAAAHQRRLEEEFGAAAAPEISALAERLRSVPAPGPQPPWRSIARSSVPGAPTVEAPAPPAAENTRRPRRRVPALLAAGSLALLALIGWIAWPRAAPARSIVVLPFANLAPGGERDHFTDGLTDEIITGLATVPGITVIARTSAMRYANSVLPLPEIARALSVGTVLHGTVRREGSRARVSAQLVEAEGERVLWARTYDSELGDIFRVQDRIARDVVRSLEVELAGDTARALVRRGTRDAEAYEMYQRGRFLWSLRTPDAVEQALGYFQKAIARDSGYADAYAGIADAHLVSWQLRLSDITEEDARSRLTWAAERAVALDDASADAHTSLAVAHWWRQNWPGAERELRRAMALNPNHATARSWYSILLTGLGRQGEAVAEARRAAELDPYALIIVSTYGWQCQVAREWECAVEQFRRTLELNPRWWPGARSLAVTYAMQGRHAEAQATILPLLEADSIPGGTYSDLALVQALAGESAAARESLRRAEELSASPFGVALAYVALGERDSAFAALDRVTDWAWPHRSTVADPALDPLRSDPRFARLSERIEREMGLR